MTRKLTNQGKAWTRAHETQLRALVKGNTPTRLIALKSGRTPASVRSKAQELKISLKPVNKSPYNRA